MITSELLRRACKDQKAIFVQKWPDGAEVTIENVQRAVELGLDLNWGMRWFTPEALEEYERQVAPIREAYERQIAPLYKDFERQIAPIREAYERQIAPRHKDFERGMAPFLEAYERQLAPIWLEAFLASRGEK